MDDSVIKINSEVEGQRFVSSGTEKNCFVWEYEGETGHIRHSPRAIMVGSHGRDRVLAHTDSLWVMTEMDHWDEYIPNGTPVYDFVAAKLCEAVSRMTSELHPFADWPDKRKSALVKLYERLDAVDGSVEARSDYDGDPSDNGVIS